MAATTNEVVVLGAGYAGLRCAMRLAWRDPQASITVVDARDTLCERIRLHQAAAGQPVPRRELGSMCRDAGITFVRARAERIDADAQVIHTDVGELRYDRLVLALGSHTDLSTPGAAEYCDRLGDEAGALVLARRVANLPDGAELVVVGGGLTGIETASELAQAWPRLHVQLVTRDALADGLLGEPGLLRVRASLTRLGVRVHEHFEVRAVERSRLCGPAATLPFHLCVWTPGFRAPALARDSGLAVDGQDRLRVDATLRCAEHPEIYGIGDAAITEATLAPLLMSCRVALPMAGLAADNLAREREGAALRPFVMRDVLRCISLGRDDGLVQLHRGDGSLRELAFGGGAAAWLKEKICRYTVWLLEHEARTATRARRKQPALAAAAVTR
jgi:NADH:ubiquinone reductase (H+-translocating)